MGYKTKAQLRFLVALFTRAWIEIALALNEPYAHRVALFTRAWIEMLSTSPVSAILRVALFTRAWIEMLISSKPSSARSGRPLHEGVD